MRVIILLAALLCGLPVFAASRCAVDVPLQHARLAEVTLALPATAPTLLLPNASLKRRGDQTGVWRLEGDALRALASHDAL